MRRQTSRGTTWRGGIRPRLVVLSSRLNASLMRDALGRVEFGCRWCDAETGRWISKHPILLDGGWNFYAFCDNRKGIKTATWDTFAIFV